MGNRLTKNSASYAYDDADRLTSAGSTTYTWDNNGNLTARGADAFTWDAEDRLISATVNSVTTAFAYKGDGLRDSLTVSSSTTTFTWDVNLSIPQVLDASTGSAQAGDMRYVFGLGRIAQVAGSAARYYLTDGLGSTMALIDGTGAVVNGYDYDVFGEVRASSGSQANEFTFAGEQVDGSTGLQYLRARYYDMAGRFVSRDPLARSPAWPGHSFSYVENNPTRYIDPTGLWCPRNPEDCVPAPVKRAAQELADTVSGATHAFGSGYLDANITVCATFGGCITTGFQTGLGQGFHPYIGGGIGVPGASASLIAFPNQAIRKGLSCGLQVNAPVLGPAGVSGEFGIAGLEAQDSSGGKGVGTHASSSRDRTVLWCRAVCGNARFRRNQLLHLLTDQRGIPRCHSFCLACF